MCFLEEEAFPDSKDFLKKFQLYAKKSIVKHIARYKNTQVIPSY
jgi:hypothetical protein